MSYETDLKIDIKAGFGFDPEWDVWQAQKAGSDGPVSPFFRWAAWKRLEDYKENFEAGTKESLFSALSLCSRHNLPMPKWLADEYSKGFHEWVSYRKPSLDEAFDVKIPKGKHILRLCQLRRFKVEIPLLVNDFHSKGRAIDEQLFADIGEKLGISGSKTRDIYYKHNPFRDLQKKR